MDRTHHAVVTITVKDFMKLGHTHWKEQHWTRFNEDALPKDAVRYQVGFIAKDGNIHPFAVWIV